MSIFTLSKNTHYKWKTADMLGVVGVVVVGLDVGLDIGLAVVGLHVILFYSP